MLLIEERLYIVYQIWVPYKQGFQRLFFSKGRGRGSESGRGPRAGQGRGGRDDTRTVEELLEDINFQEGENGVCCSSTRPELLKQRVGWGTVSGGGGQDMRDYQTDEGW